MTAMSLNASLGPRVKIFLGKESDLPVSSREKLQHLLTLKDIVEIIVLPDVHSKPDNPFPTGIATLTKNTIYPYAIGQEIGCGMRVLLTSLEARDMKDQLYDAFFKSVKFSLRDGRKKDPFFSREVYLDILMGKFSLKDSAFDIDRQNSPLKDLSGQGTSLRQLLRAIPTEALQSGYYRLGSLGGGNHFLEIQVVKDIFDESLAKRAGLTRGQILIMFHTGSLTISKRLDNYYGIRFEEKASGAMRKKWRKILFHFHDGRFFRLAKRLELFFGENFEGIPADSPEGRRYWTAFQAIKNYSHMNRAIISEFIKQSLADVFRNKPHVRLLSDADHESIDHERFGTENFWVHRNGATKISHSCRDRMEILPIPSFMGGPTFLCLAGPDIARSRYSVNHGVGRTLTKQEAKKTFSIEEIHQELKEKNIRLYKLGDEDLREQGPRAFKDINEIIPVLKNHRLMDPVAVTHPLAILKG